jgi:hypothetical protein
MEGGVLAIAADHLVGAGPDLMLGDAYEHSLRPALLRAKV